MPGFVVVFDQGSVLSALVCVGVLEDFVSSVRDDVPEASARPAMNVSVAKGHLEVGVHKAGRCLTCSRRKVHDRCRHNRHVRGDRFSIRKCVLTARQEPEFGSGHRSPFDRCIANIGKKSRPRVSRVFLLHVTPRRYPGFLQRDRLEALL